MSERLGFHNCGRIPLCTGSTLQFDKLLECGRFEQVLLIPSAEISIGEAIGFGVIKNPRVIPGAHQTGIKAVLGK